LPEGEPVGGSHLGDGRLLIKRLVALANRAAVASLVLGEPRCRTREQRFTFLQPRDLAD